MSCWAYEGFAQQLEWRMSAFGFADNREYSVSALPSKTIFGMRFSPELGILVDSTHRFRIGVNYLKEFGNSEKFATSLDPVIYYSYEKAAVKFNIGAFPRFGHSDLFPRAVLIDTLQYYRPNIEGMLFNYTKPNFRHSMWIDWYGRQSETVREQFMAGWSGALKSTIWSFRYFGYYFHDANKLEYDPERPLRDNGSLLLTANVDLTEKTALDSLSVAVGWQSSMDRIRSVTDLRFAHGLYTELYLGYRRFFLDNIFYTGSAQLAFMADRFYGFKHYNRTDIGWKAIHSNYVDASLVLSFHHTPHGLDNQQAFLLRYNLEGVYRKR
ncbi:hypothetical protein [Olivibacter sitiensis]|uniref:hypothetical protein n=1 Tax=Olivibacter sitiensis TaxID=376470 RepID=UPI00068882F0|nr:hypothetical protein [Olivibacter sitiensis]